MKPIYTCCICGKQFEGYGNNPEPVHAAEDNDGFGNIKIYRCCDACNLTVLMERMHGYHFDDYSKN